MAFAITVDHIDDGDSLRTIGPRGTKLTYDDIVNHPQAKPFRMFDDDGELYYEGFLVGEDEFQPLDCFGMPNSGCTTIQYKNANGVWENLQSVLYRPINAVDASRRTQTNYQTRFGKIMREDLSLRNLADSHGWQIELSEADKKRHKNIWYLVKVDCPNDNLIFTKYDRIVWYVGHGNWCMATRMRLKYGYRYQNHRYFACLRDVFVDFWTDGTDFSETNETDLWIARELSIYKYDLAWTDGTEHNIL